MKADRLEKWKQTRSRGFLRYVFAKGVLMIGLPLFLMMSFFMRRNDIDLKFSALSLLLFVIGGAMVGVAMWVVQERLFRNAVKASS